LEKRGLKERLQTALETVGKTLDKAVTIAFSDEMRLGLIGQVRRVLAPKGVKIVQPLQREYVYEYLLLAVIPEQGILKWSWMPRMKQEHIKLFLKVGTSILLSGMELAFIEAVA
jgi:hypothetical protein